MNYAKSNENSVAAINSGSGDQNIDNSTHIHLSGLVNLIETAKGSIIFDPKAMREIILSIDESMDELSNRTSDFTSIDIDKKNQINGLSQEFYDDFIAVEYEPYFLELDNFLKKRENEDLQIKVLNIAQNLNKKIFIRRKEFETFEELLLEIEAALLDSEYEHLQNKEQTIGFFLYYLYGICLVGKKTQREKS